MIGTLTNTALIVVGSALGVFLAGRGGFSENKGFIQMMGVFVILTGLQSAMAINSGAKFVGVMAAVLIGGVLGEALRLEKRLEAFTAAVEKRLAGHRVGEVERKSVFRAFVSASILYCVGPMAILGAIQDGLRGDPSILVSKAVLDGAMSVALAATLGFGVVFSAAAVLLYQGGIALLAAQAEAVLTPAVMGGITGAGGMLLLFTGFNIVGVTRINVVNLLPGLLLGALAAPYFWTP